MKKTLLLLFTFGAFFISGRVDAQFRSLPGVVTDSFKVRYPSASGVTWSDKVSAFQAVFTVDKEKYVARYSKDGQWQGSTKTILKDAIPAAVKDGLAKSKYASIEWEIRDITVKYLPGGFVNYIIQVAKSDVQKKNLVFTSEGQLLKDGNTL